MQKLKFINYNVVFNNIIKYQILKIIKNEVNLNK